MANISDYIFAGKDGLDGAPGADGADGASPPAGTDTQTLRYNGTTLESTSALTVDASGNITATSITLGTWTLSDSAGKLIFDNGTTKVSIASDGAIISKSDITAFGTP